MSMISKKKLYIGVVSAFIFCMIVSVIFKFLYEYVPTDAIPQYSIQNAYYTNYHIAKKGLDNLEQKLRHGTINDIVESDVNQVDGVSYYSYRKDSLVYWSTNELVVKDYLP